MLQGTLDVFSLDEVLGLLSGANKSGVLNVTGDRGVGAISLADGHLVAGSASCAPDATELHDVIFELLRFAEGSFSFDGNASVDGEPVDIETVLNGAHARLSEWLQIEAVVPTLDHRLALAETLSTTQVTISETEWATIVAIGEGATVGTVAHRLGLGEFDGSKRVKGLIERELVSIEATGASAEPEIQTFEAPVPVAEIAPDPIAEVPVAEMPVFETPAPEPASLDTAFDAAFNAETVTEPDTEPDTGAADEVAGDADVDAEAVAAAVESAPEASAFVDHEIPPMPEAPAFGDNEIPPMPEAPVSAFDEPAMPTFADGEIPPMPEPPAPQIESAIAEEFAAPTAPGEPPASSFGGLDPIGSVDMFEEPTRVVESPPEPPAPAPVAAAPEAPAPSFARPEFDPDDFATGDDSADMGSDPFASAEADAPTLENVDPVDDESTDDGDEPEKGGSLLMRYLKSNH